MGPQRDMGTNRADQPVARRPIERLIASASLDQRAVLGFPRPGSGGWCGDTIAAVEARFGPLGFDANPFREAGR